MGKSHFILSEEKEPQLFELIKNYSLAVGIAIFIADINGYQKSKIPDCHLLCQSFKSNHKKKQICENCQMHQMMVPIKKGNIDKYICHGGFTHVPLPVYINNILVGYIIIGQLAEQQNSYLLESAARGVVPHQKSSFNYYSTARREKIIELFINLAQNILITTNPKRKIDIGHLSEANAAIEVVPEKTEIVKAVRYIKKNLHRKLCLEEVANEVYLSQYYFSKLFKKELGMNFVSYLKYQRIVKAKELLRNSNLSIEEVGRRVGFSQTSYFCKSFRDIAANSPASFRKKEKVGNYPMFEHAMTI